jgi:hypothetical protein
MVLIRPTQNIIGMILLDMFIYILSYVFTTFENWDNYNHIQRLVGNIPVIELQNGMDVTEEQVIIVAIYGSVVFGVGYLSWVFVMDND